MVDLYDRFVAYLQHFAVGAEHAQTAVTICAALGLEPSENNRRAIRGCAEQASACGELVCSGQRGYYLPASTAEVRAATAPLKSQARVMEERAKRMERIATLRFSPPTRPALFDLMETGA